MLLLCVSGAPGAHPGRCRGERGHPPCPRHLRLRHTERYPAATPAPPQRWGRDGGASGRGERFFLGGCHRRLPKAAPAPGERKMENHGGWGGLGTGTRSPRGAPAPAGSCRGSAAARTRARSPCPGPPGVLACTKPTGLRETHTKSPFSKGGKSGRVTSGANGSCEQDAEGEMPNSAPIAPTPAERCCQSPGLPLPTGGDVE